jgi:hypothetical protein
MRRAALRNGIHVQRLHALLKRRVVDGQRAFQECIAGKRHQAEPVGLRGLHQFQRGELGAGQPVRGDVRRQHGFGSVHGHDDVQAALLTSSRSKPCCGRASGNDQKCHRRQQQKA